MNQVIIYEEENTMKVCIPSENMPIQDVIKKDIPKDVACYVIDKSKIPTDRTFRNAWTLSGGNVSIDIAKAKEIAKNIVRAKRKPMLENLDVEYMKAIEKKDQLMADSIALQKQALRDITQNADSINTVENLKSWINSIQ